MKSRFLYSCLTITIVLAVFVSATLPSQVYFAYKINKSEFIQKYCVNKDKPAMNCEGKCHLSKQFEAVDDTGDEKNQTLEIVEEYVPLWSQQSTILPDYGKNLLAELETYLSNNQPRSGFEKILLPPPEA